MVIEYVNIIPVQDQISKIDDLEIPSAYKICEQCGKEFRIVNEYREICFDCYRKEEGKSEYSKYYNSLKTKGYTYDQINRNMQNIINHNEIRYINSIYIRDPKSGKILYYHYKCPFCGEKLTRLNFFHEITDYVCDLYYKCNKCNHYSHINH